MIFESERIKFIKPSMDLIPDYLEMVNDIENVARFISDRREHPRQYYCLRMKNQLISSLTSYQTV